MKEPATVESAYQKGVADAKRGYSINSASYQNPEVMKAWIKGFEETKFPRPKPEPKK